MLICLCADVLTCCYHCILISRHVGMLLCSDAVVLTCEYDDDSITVCRYMGTLISMCVGMLVYWSVGIPGYAYHDMLIYCYAVMSIHRAVGMLYRKYVNACTCCLLVCLYYGISARLYISVLICWNASVHIC